ncbi:MAG: cobalamin biosynthesis protein [Clostridiaceae bacterium]|nr:cobalamin biosynthesis protein [Clostridiaceae bacterium]
MYDILAAVILDWIIGDPYWFPHPIKYIGKLIKALEGFGRRHIKSNKTMKIYGGGVVVIVAFISFIIPFTILKAAKNIPLLFHLINVLILWTTLAARCLHSEAKKVYTALKEKGIEEARIKLSYIVGRDTSLLTEGEIIRADVETVAENTSDGVIAPMIFAIIGGAPLAMLYKGINTMDSMLGYMNEKYRFIGFFPAKTDDVFNFIPARITGILLSLVSPIKGGSIINSLRIMWRDRKNHKSPNCAYPEAAVAGALKIQLGGTNVYFGETLIKPTMGDKIKQLSKEHIIAAIQLMYASEVLLLVIILLVKELI